MRKNNTQGIIVIALCLMLFLCGCIGGQNDEKPPKPVVPLSSGGLIPIGVKRYTEVERGEVTVFDYRLEKYKTYVFFMNYVDDHYNYVANYAGVDNDLILRDSDGKILDTSTESVGLQERIEYTPDESGIYSVVVANDAKESTGNWPVSLIATEKYHTGASAFISGKDMNTQAPLYETYYAFFIDMDSYNPLADVVNIIVPDELDMYQARMLCFGEGDNMNIMMHLDYNPESTFTSVNSPYYSFETLGEDGTLELTHEKDCILQLIGEIGQGVVSFDFEDTREND